MCSLAEGFPSPRKTLDLTLAQHMGMVVHACNLNTQKVELRGLEIQGQLWLHSKYAASLGYERPYPKSDWIREPHTFKNIYMQVLLLLWF